MRAWRRHLGTTLVSLPVGGETDEDAANMITLMFIYLDPH